MSLRLVEIVLPEADRESFLEDLVEERLCVQAWSVAGPDGEPGVVRLLVSTGNSEELLDHAVEVLGDRVRIVVTAVEATLPRVEDDEGDEEDGTPAEGEPWVFRRISREELHADVADSARLTPDYFAMVLLSSLVAGLGLIADDVAIIIGAMVIAPLLGPNVALALATTLADLELGRRSLAANAAGVAAALVPAALLGLFLFPDEPGAEIAGRASADFLDLAVALAAGGAGALSFTLGVPAALVGVMVAVALMPPLVLTGMAVGAAEWGIAFGALLLTGVNVICVNLAGVVTFLLLGVRPASWYDAERAGRAARIAVTIWAVLLAALAALIGFTGLP